MVKFHESYESFFLLWFHENFQNFLGKLKERFQSFFGRVSWKFPKLLWKNKKSIKKAFLKASKFLKILEILGRNYHLKFQFQKNLDIIQIFSWKPWNFPITLQHINPFFIPLNINKVISIFTSNPDYFSTPQPTNFHSTKFPSTFRPPSTGNKDHNRH